MTNHYRTDKPLGKEQIGKSEMFSPALRISNTINDFTHRESTKLRIFITTVMVSRTVAAVVFSARPNGLTTRVSECRNNLGWVFYFKKAKLVGEVSKRCTDGSAWEELFGCVSKQSRAKQNSFVERRGNKHTGDKPFIVSLDPHDGVGFTCVCAQNMTFVGNDSPPSHLFAVGCKRMRMCEKIVATSAEEIQCREIAYIGGQYEALPDFPA